MDKNEVKDKIYKAYRKLLSKDSHLFEMDANERSITHKLAEYLQNEFTEWNIDCEYNRNGINSKKLNSFKKKIDSNDTNAVTVYPDIIIHHRGTKNNLIVIEAKKSSRDKNLDKDEEKLKAYLNDLNYKFAFKIEFPVENDFKNVKTDDCYIEEIKTDGKK